MFKLRQEEWTFFYVCTFCFRVIMKALPLSDSPGKEAYLLFLFFLKEKKHYLRVNTESHRAEGVIRFKRAKDWNCKKRLLW
jgi:hypothetical protein